ncbi:hypothetical protein BC832DRAFT_554273 [Gaertneriomyces semiglobifer]|nr:hypothetical protein BC832DRAFT_554273 [Gaertneriomyces semiglobifer]
MRTDTGWHAKHDHIGNAVNLDGTLPANDNWKPQSKRENTSKVPFYLGGADEHHGDRDGRMGKMKKLQSAIYSVPEEQVQRQARDREDLARYAEVQRQERQEQKLQERQRKLEEDSRLQWLLDGRAKAEKSDKDYFLDTRVPRSDRVKESYSHAVAQKEQRQHGLFAGLGETHKATNWETRGRLRTNLPHAPNPIAATENVKVGEALPESQEHFSRQGQGRNRVDPISWRNLPSIPDGDYRKSCSRFVHKYTHAHRRTQAGGLT